MNSIRLRHLLSQIVIDNDRRAFSVFFDYYNTRLMNLAMLYITQYDQAEEVVSEVFLKLLSMKEKLLKIERFEGYLFMMVKNHALNHLKSMKKSKDDILIDDIKDHLTTDLIDPDKKLINDDLRVELNQAIQKLPPKRRLVFKMVKDEGMSYREVANILDISERTIEVHLKLAIQDLRIELKSYYDEHKNDLKIGKQRFLSMLL